MSVQNFTFQLSQVTSFASLTPQYIFSIRKYHDKHRKNAAKKIDKGRKEVLCAESFNEAVRNLRQNPLEELLSTSHTLKKIQKNIVHNPIKSHWKTSYVSGHSFLHNKTGRYLLVQCTSMPWKFSCLIIHMVMKFCEILWLWL